VHVGGIGPEALLVGRDLVRHREREQRAAVVAVRERYDARPARRVAGDLHGILDRFGARRQEERLFRKVAGRERAQPLGERHIPLVHADLEARVRERVDLCVHRREDGGMRVTDVLRADAAREVHVLATVDVPEPCSLGACHEKRERRRDAARDHALAPLGELVRSRSGRLHGRAASLAQSLHLRLTTNVRLRHAMRQVA